MNLPTTLTKDFAGAGDEELFLAIVDVVDVECLASCSISMGVSTEQADMVEVVAEDHGKSVGRWLCCSLARN